MQSDMEVIIVAGGSGQRMESTTPKQFLLLGGLPVLMHTIRNLSNAVNRTIHTSDNNAIDNNTYRTISAQTDNNRHDHVNNSVNNNVDNSVNNSLTIQPTNIIVVLPQKHLDLWQELCGRHNFDIPHTVVAGGANRFESVKNGLIAMQSSDLVAIHDGVRPFVSQRMMSELTTTAREFRTAIPVVPLVDSLRIVINNHSEIVDRSSFRAVQTPQIFNQMLITRAYEQPYDPAFTDDASVVESIGLEIKLVEGDPQNFKITTPLDLKFAEMLVSTQPR